MSQTFFTAHARERAKERYGLDLEAHEIWDIWRECADGRAVLQRSSANRLIFVLTFKGKRVVPVLNSSRTLLITFLPPDAITAVGVLKYNRAKGKIKQCTGVAHGFTGRRYKKRQKICVSDLEDIE